MCRGKVDKKVGAIENSDPDFIGSIEVANINGTKHIKLSHKEYSDITGWATKQNNEHPMVTVGIEVAEEEFTKFGHPLAKRRLNSVSRRAVADTGAMIMVAGEELVAGLGLSTSDLIPVSTELSAANNSELKILGGVFLQVWGRKTSGEKIVTRQMCYIQKGANKVYLSENCCVNLGLISTNFPLIGECLHADSINTAESSTSRCDRSHSDDNCSCPKREKPPPKPTALPYAPTAENKQKLKKWILDKIQSKHIQHLGEPGAAKDVRATTKDGCRSQCYSFCSPYSNTCSHSLEDRGKVADR